MSQRNCQNQLSHLSLFHIEQECQEEFNSRKDSHSTKFEWRPSFRELCDSKFFFSILYFTLRYNVHLEIFNRSINNSSNIILIISPYFIELQIGQKQKGRQWVYEAPIFEVIFVTLTENSLVVTNDTQGPPEIVDMALQLPQYFYQPVGKILVATSKFGVLTIRWHSATRKHLFLYPQGDRSGLRKPKK